MNQIKKVISKAVADDSPWQFRLLAILVLLFFGGGLLLDAWAAQIPLPDLGDSIDLNQMKIDFTKSKHDSLTSSASLLYDFAKIVLGALIASITQSLKQTVKEKGEST